MSQEPSISEATSTPPQEKHNNKSTTPILIALVVVILILLISNLYFIATRTTAKSANNQIVTSETTSPISPTPTPSKTTSAISWTSYTHDKFATTPDWDPLWGGFTLYYPSTWQIEENRQQNPPSLNVKFANNSGDYFQIIQGESSFGRCHFPDEPDYDSYEGMGIQFFDYLTVPSPEGIIWRLSELPFEQSNQTHALCQQMEHINNDDSYYSVTSLGYTFINATTSESLSQILQILERVELTAQN